MGKCFADRSLRHTLHPKALNRFAFESGFSFFKIQNVMENEFAFSLGLERQEVGPYIHDLWTRAAAEG